MTWRCLQYTGGTTGKPKAAMLSHANLTSTISIYKIWGDAQRLTEPGTDKVICVLPLFHIYALTSVLLRGLRDGNEILLRMRFDVETTLRDIEVKRATAFPGVPTMWIALGQHARHRDSGIFPPCASSAPAAPAFPSRWRRGFIG